MTWTQPEELVTYLAYAEKHKEELLKLYGDKRWISHSGQANGSRFYLDEIFRTVSWEMPVDMQRNVTATAPTEDDKGPRPASREPVRMHLLVLVWK